MKITKAVIPVAGHGTRMFPITKAFPKEFMPIKNSNNEMKPAIMYLLEELDSAGIEEIYMIVQDGYQKDFYEHFFREDVHPFCYSNLSSNQKEYLNKIKSISKKLRIISKENMPGFGYVLYYCHELIEKDEEFLLLLGDQIYSSYEKSSCIEQIMNHHRYGDLTIAAAKVDLSSVHHYGIMKGEILDDQSFIIDQIVEKPSIEYARNHLSMNDYGSDTYFCVFGTYILNRKIVDEAVYFFDHESKLKIEYQLTPFLQHYQGRKEAFIPNGRYFDIGNIDCYNETYISFQQYLTSDVNDLD